MEKASAQRCRDLDKKASQNETNKIYIAGMEKKIEDLITINATLQRTVQLQQEAQTDTNGKSHNRENQDDSNFHPAHQQEQRHYDSTRQYSHQNMNQSAHAQPSGPQCRNLYQGYNNSSECMDMCGNRRGHPEYNALQNIITQTRMEAMEARIQLAIRESETRLTQTYLNLSMQQNLQHNLLVNQLSFANQVPKPCAYHSTLFHRNDQNAQTLPYQNQQNQGVESRPVLGARPSQQGNHATANNGGHFQHTRHASWQPWRNSQAGSSGWRQHPQDADGTKARGGTGWASWNSRKRDGSENAWRRNQHELPKKKREEAVPDRSEVGGTQNNNNLHKPADGQENVEEQDSKDPTTEIEQDNLDTNSLKESKPEEGHSTMPQGVDASNIGMTEDVAALDNSGDQNGGDSTKIE